MGGHFAKSRPPMLLCTAGFVAEVVPNSRKENLNLAFLFKRVLDGWLLGVSRGTVPRAGNSIGRRLLVK